MTTGELVTLIGILLGTGGLGAIATLWLRRKREPIEQDSLALANAKASILIAQGVARDVDEQMDRMQNRFNATIADMRRELDAARQDSRQARDEVRRMGNRLSSLEDTRRSDQGWIRRTIERITAHDPQLIELLLPFPKWLTPPGGIPAQPRKT